MLFKNARPEPLKKGVVGRDAAMRAIKIAEADARQWIDEWSTKFRMKMQKGSKKERTLRKMESVLESKLRKIRNVIFKIEQKRNDLTNRLVKIRRDAFTDVVKDARMYALMNGIDDVLRAKIQKIGDF